MIMHILLSSSNYNNLLKGDKISKVSTLLLLCYIDVVGCMFLNSCLAYMSIV